MSEDRFILVNGISEERKFCVLLKTATSFLKRDLAWFNSLNVEDDYLNRQEWHVAFMLTGKE